MRKSNFSNKPSQIVSRWSARLAAAILPFSLALNGCYVVRTKSDIIGTYTLAGGHGKIDLIISSDGNFQETIHWGRDRSDVRTGRWYWNRGAVALDGLWIPKAFAPEDVVKADARSEADRPKFTDPGNWAVSAEKHWGTVTLSIFPDEDVEFRMTAHAPN